MHWARRAASRADCTAGNRSEISTAMIAMTTKSSISVKPANRLDVVESRFMLRPPKNDPEILHSFIQNHGVQPGEVVPPFSRSNQSQPIDSSPV